VPTMIYSFPSPEIRLDRVSGTTAERITCYELITTTDFVFLPNVASISNPLSFASPTILLIGAESGDTTATIFSAFSILPKPIFTSLRLLKVLNLLPYLFNFSLYTNNNHRNICVLRFTSDCVCFTI